MISITLNNLDPQLTQHLQERAQQNGRTLEAEITAILSSVLVPESANPSTMGLATAIGRHFTDIDDFEIPETPREPIRNPPTFF